MQACVVDSANPRLHCTHGITAMDSIGASFHFVVIDNSLTQAESHALVDKRVFDTSAGAPRN